MGPGTCFAGVVDHVVSAFTFFTLTGPSLDIPSLSSSHLAASPLERFFADATRETGSPPFSSVAKSAHLPVSRLKEKDPPAPPCFVPATYSLPLISPSGAISLIASSTTEKEPLH